MSNDYIWHEIAQEVRDAPAHYGTVGAYMSTSHLSMAEDTEAKKAEAIEQMRQIMDSAEPGQYRFATTMGQLGAPTTTLLFMGEDRMLYIARRPGINLVEYNGGLNITVPCMRTNLKPGVFNLNPIFALMIYDSLDMRQYAVNPAGIWAPHELAILANLMLRLHKEAWKERS